MYELFVRADSVTVVIMSSSSLTRSLRFHHLHQELKDETSCVSPDVESCVGDEESPHAAVLIEQLRAGRL